MAWDFNMAGLARRFQCSGLHVCVYIFVLSTHLSGRVKTGGGAGNGNDAGGGDDTDLEKMKQVHY